MSEESQKDTMTSSNSLEEPSPTKEPIVTSTPTSEKKHCQFDRVLTFYSKFISKSVNHDKVLKLLQWSLFVASVGIARIPRQNNGNNDKQRRRSENIVAGLLKLYNEVSMARYVIRLVQFPTAVEAWRTESWTLDPNNGLYKMIGKILAGSMVLYYPTEMLAYTHWVAPQLFTTSTSRTGNRWSYISCRFWVLYIVAELTQGVLRWKELRCKIQEWEDRLNRKHVIEAQSTDTVISIDSDDDQEEYEQLVSSYKSNQLQVYRNLLFLLPCINWSLPNWDTKPLLPTTTVNSIMWLESIVSMYQAVIGQK